MARKIISCSISEEQHQAIEQLQLEPSKLLQGKIDECIENQKFSKEIIEEMQRKLTRFRESHEKVINFLIEKKLYDEFFGIDNVVQ